ncbi:MAG: hypothetical protein HYZ28_18870 [Myxococcales bacterium]|nr:hypothetical protein [Myxococcales bacterium]
MAKYRVKTKDGELTYGSFREVEWAWLQGLVGPEDEVLEEGTSRWRRAGSIPLLVQARRQGNQVWGGTQMAWIVIGVVMASTALYLISRGRYLAGGLVALIVAMVLFRVTVSAYKKSRPHG